MIDKELILPVISLIVSVLVLAFAIKVHNDAKKRSNK
jgi:hypothetical protein